MWAEGLCPTAAGKAEAFRPVNASGLKVFQGCLGHCELLEGSKSLQKRTRMRLEKKGFKASVARIVGVSRTTLHLISWTRK
jgi:hypothetical protein